MSPIDNFIAPFPAQVRERMEQVRQTIRNEAPDSVEVLSYGIPTFDLLGKHLVHFSGYAHHIGFYPGPRPLVAFREALESYKSAKGSVQFPHDRLLPLELIRQMVQFRLAELRAEVQQPKARRRSQATG